MSGVRGRVRALPGEAGVRPAVLRQDADEQRAAPAVPQGAADMSCELYGPGGDPHDTGGQGACGGQDMPFEFRPPVTGHEKCVRMIG